MTGQVSQTISADRLLPKQASVLDAALRHVGCREEVVLPSFLQVAAGNTLQTSGEGLFLCLAALILVAMVVGALAFWFTVYESGKSMPGESLKQESARPTRNGNGHSHLAPEQRSYGGRERVSTATSLFPAHMVGSEIHVKGALTTDPQDLVVEVFDVEGGLILRALVCEMGADPGILIEDAFSTPLAFIDTRENRIDKSASKATPRLGAAPTGVSPTLHIHKLGENEGVFGIIRQEDDNGRLVVRCASGRTLLALQGDSSGRSLNAVNDHAQLVGTVQGIPSKKDTKKVMMLPGADAGVMICGLLGIGKIGKVGPTTSL